MRAALVRELGTIPVVGEHPAPVRASGALVRVGAAPVVPLDVLCASGTSYFGRRRTPYVPGVQGVGVVEESDTLPTGTRVWFATSAGMVDGDGSLAPWCAVADDDLVPITADVTDAALAALGLSAVAAWMSLTWRAGMQAGERVLVLGGGGAVGQSAIGAARVLGAGQVVAVCRSAGAADRATAAGADEVVEHVDDVAELAARLSAACEGPVDVVVDPVFGRRCRSGDAGARRRRAAGPPRRFLGRRSDLLVGDAAQQVDLGPRLHEQRDLRGPAGRGRHPDRRARSGRPDAGGAPRPAARPRRPRPGRRRPTAGPARDSCWSPEATPVGLSGAAAASVGYC